MSQYSIEKGFYDEAIARGWNGRSVVKDRPELANHSVDVCAHQETHTLSDWHWQGEL